MAGRKDRRVHREGPTGGGVGLDAKDLRTPFSSLGAAWDLSAGADLLARA